MLIDPEREITVTCGSTPRFVTLRLVTGEGGARSWAYDPEELRRAFGPRTRAVILNTPNNPTP